MVVKEVNRKKRLSWCREKRWWTVQQHWKKVIFSDESKIMIGHDERVYVWRKCGEGWRPDLVPSANVKPKYEAMIWGCITFNGVGTISDVRGNINSEKYQEILENGISLLEVICSKMTMLRFTAHVLRWITLPGTILNPCHVLHNHQT